MTPPASQQRGAHAQAATDTPAHQPASNTPTPRPAIDAPARQPASNTTTSRQAGDAPVRQPASYAAARRLVGAHAPVSGGLARRGLRYATAVDAQAIQVFVTNPRGWASARPDPEQDATLRAHAERTRLPVFVHAPYLINVASPDHVVRERSVRSLRETLSRGREIGASGVVVHTGSAIEGSHADALRRVRASLLPLLDELLPDGPDLLLEPTAGQGQMLCGLVGDLEPYLDTLDWHPRANICLDTCHAFAAGHDLTAPDGVPLMLTALQQATRDPAGRLRLIHANDSKAACGSRRDLHENVGSGQIGVAPFAALLAHPVTAGVPFIVETPGDEAGHAADIKTLRTADPSQARQSAAIRLSATAPAPPNSVDGTLLRCEQQ